MWTSVRTHLALALGLALAALALPLAAGPAFAGATEQAQKALEAGDFDKATDLFAKALKADASDRLAALGLADASVKGGRADVYYDALDTLAALRQKNRKDLEVHVAMGELNIAIANTKTDPQTLKGYFADAQANFEAALVIEPQCEDAAVGLARSLYFTGDFPGAAQAIDNYLGQEPPLVGKAYYWKGQALYMEAMDTYQASGSVTEQVKEQFLAAQGAYAASTAADPSSYDAWIQLAYAAHYGGDEGTAKDAYRSAFAADQTKDAALRGLASLYQYENHAYTGILAELVEAHPENAIVLLFAAVNHFAQDRHDEARPLLERQVQLAEDPSEGWYFLGRIAHARDDVDAAKKAYTKALDANGGNVNASYWYSTLLLGKQDAASISQSLTVASATELIGEFRRLFKLAPSDPWIRNNLGLVLRDAWVSHARDGGSGWNAALKAGADAYESAAEIIGEWDDRYLTSMTWELRYGYAQVVSDTGLMFQFHPPIKDYDKAEAYYLRSLEFSEDGYFDAWTNLWKIYDEQKRWDDLYDLAELCADGLVDKDRNPHETGRAQARGLMQKLVESGRVSGN